MDNELRYFLQQGPTSVKELARLTGKSKSTLYKALKDPEVKETSFDPPLPYGASKLFYITPEAPVEAPESAPQNEAPASPPPAAEVSLAPSKRGRKQAFAGKQLYPDASLLSAGDEAGAGTYQNPRRKESAGGKSLQIIIDKPGITTEDYLAAGGRSNDLRWDVARGRVRAE